MPSLPQAFAIAGAMVDEAERKMPPAVRARMEMEFCFVTDCSTPALPHHNLWQRHYREVLAELEAWGASRTLRDQSGAICVRDLLELVCVIASAQFAGLVLGLLLVV